MEDQLKVVTHELDPSTAEWFVSVTEHSASFKIEQIAARLANEIYLSGTARNGDSVIERWIITPPAGAMLPTRPAATTAIGVPFTSPGLTVQIQGGGAFVSPLQRQGRSITTKTELYRGSDLGEIVSLSVDPDGRFLLALTYGAHGLVQFDLQDSAPAGPSYHTIIDPLTVPEIQHVDRIYPAEHVNGIRMELTDPVYAFGVYPKIVVLMDDDNDGVFQSNYILSQAEYDQLFPPGSIKDYFIWYR